MLFKIIVEFADEDKDECFVEADSVYEASALATKSYSESVRDELKPITVVSIEKLSWEPVIR